MPFPYIDGKTTRAPAQPVDLPLPQRHQQSDSAAYLMDDKLADAVNVALALSQPLLLTGEPGTGKTELAHRVAWELGYGTALVFNTKSTSSARDLFYTFDTMGRFHAAHTGGSADNLDYITYNALGIAILQSRPRSDVAGVLPPGFEHTGPRRAVVLIDEIDKAPRDFPNDLLHEVVALSFRIQELRNAEIVANRTLRPVLVLTSNSEKNLPDAFLRRCIFYNIPFPDQKRLTQILSARLPAFGDGKSELLASSVQFFQEVRKLNLRKPPSTAELINWLQVMVECGASPDKPVKASSKALVSSLSTLAKSREDEADLRQFVDTYLK